MTDKLRLDTETGGGEIIFNSFPVEYTRMDTTRADISPITQSYLLLIINILAGCISVVRSVVQTHRFYDLIKLILKVGTNCSSFWQNKLVLVSWDHRVFLHKVSFFVCVISSKQTGEFAHSQGRTS